MKKFFKGLDYVVDGLEIITMTLMVAVIFMQVICRYVFNNALSWPEEAGRYLFCLGTYLAVCISMRGDHNLRITIFLDMLKRKSRKRLNLACCTANIFFFALLTWLTWDVTFQVKEMEEMMSSMPLPVWYVWMGLPVCFALITVQALRNLFLIAADKIGETNA